MQLAQSREDEMIETWLPILGYEGLYEVSDLGRVRSMDRVVTRRGRGTLRVSGQIIKDFRVGDGYRGVTLCIDGSTKKISVHVLVCAAFHGPKPSPAHEVAHGDGNKTRNVKDNLRWATKSSNNQDKVQHGTALRGSRNHRAKIDERTVLEMVKLVRAGEKSVDVSKRFGRNHGFMSEVMRGNRWGSITGILKHEGPKYRRRAV